MFVQLSGSLNPARSPGNQWTLPAALRSHSRVKVQGYGPAPSDEALIPQFFHLAEWAAKIVSGDGKDMQALAAGSWAVFGKETRHGGPGTGRV